MLCIHLLTTRPERQFLYVDQIGAVESVKAASDIVSCSISLSWLSLCFLCISAQFAPVSGTVEEVNATLNDQPGLLNKSPEDKGMFAWVGFASCAENSDACFRQAGCAR